MKSICITLAVCGLIGTTVDASIIVIDISNQPTGGAGIPDVVITNYLAPGAHVTGVGFDVTLQTFGSSWGSEAVIALGNTAAPFVFLTPATMGPSGGNLPIVEPTGFPSLIFMDLVSMGLDFDLNADGLLHTTLFESFDSGIPGPDGMWLDNSTVTVEWFVPSPGVFAIFGVAGFVGRRRRNRWQAE